MKVIKVVFSNHLQYYHVKVKIKGVSPRNNRGHHYFKLAWPKDRPLQNLERKEATRTVGTSQVDPGVLGGILPD